MHRSITAAATALLVVTSVAFGGVETVAAQESGTDASVSEQTTGGHTVVVDEVTVPGGGFVTLHDSTVLDGGVFDSVRGTSEYLGPDTHEEVSVQIDELPAGEDTLVAMAYLDTNDNVACDSVDEEGGADGPYTACGEPVTDAAQVTGDPEGGATETVSDGNETQEGDTVTPEGDEGATQDDAADFGVVVGLLAIVGVLLVARRRS